MAARHLLYLTNESMLSLFARGGRVTSRTEFMVESAGRIEFERHVRSLPKAPTSLITDLAEEDFRVDSVPHLGARDQRAVLDRRLTQIFRNTTFKHALAQGRETEGRRDDRVVFMAITNPDVLQPWLDILERLAVPVEGIHSSALFSGRLLDRLRLTYEHALLVTLTPGHAIRQTYFRGRELKFSRLTPLDQEAGETLGGLIAGEIGRTWQYLDGLRYFTPTDQLNACVLVHPRDRPVVEPALVDYDQIHFHLLDAAQVAAKVGLTPPPTSSSAEEILACLFLKEPAENHFAPPGLRRFATLRNARIGIGVAAGAIVALGLAFGARNLYFVVEGAEKDQITRARINGAQRQLAEIRASTPLEQVGGQTMRDAVAFYTQALRAYPDVTSMLVPVSRVLERYPKIHLTQIVWQAADDDKATLALIPMTSRDPPRLAAIAKAASAPAAVQRVPGTSIESPFSTGREAIAILEGTVTVAGLDFRGALSLLDTLVKDIGKIPGYRASVVDSPLDTTSQVAIAARLSESDPQTSEARFSLRITQKTDRPAKGFSP